MTLALLFVGSAAATAQDADDRTEQARALFHEATELARQEQWAEAVSRYRQVLELRASPNVVYNLAFALVEMDRFVEGAELAEAVASDGSAHPELRELARAVLEVARRGIGHLRVRLDGDTEGVTVTLDGDPVDAATLADAFAADPGRRVVAAIQDGEERASESVEVVSGETAEVTLVVAAPIVAPPPEAVVPIAEPDPIAAPPPEPVDDGSTSLASRWWFWAIVGVVVVGGAVGLGVALGSDDERPTQGDYTPEPVRIR